MEQWSNGAMEHWSKYGVTKGVWCLETTVAASGSGSRDEGWDGFRRKLVRLKVGASPDPSRGQTHAW